MYTLCIHGLYAHCVHTVLVAVDISPHKVLSLFCHTFCIVFYFSILSLPFPHSFLQYAILLSKFDTFFSKNFILAHTKLFISSILAWHYSVFANIKSGDALEQNFVFSSLDNVEKQMLANAMEQVEVAEGEHLITQGANIFFLSCLNTACVLWGMMLCVDGVCYTVHCSTVFCREGKGRVT